MDCTAEVVHMFCVGIPLELEEVLDNFGLEDIKFLCAAKELHEFIHQCWIALLVISDGR